MRKINLKQAIRDIVIILTCTIFFFLSATEEARTFIDFISVFALVSFFYMIIEAYIYYYKNSTDTITDEDISSEIYNAISENTPKNHKDII